VVTLPLFLIGSTDGVGTLKGRDQAREASEISFYCLRHSAVTMRKAAGVSDFIAREIVGHESVAVSRQYTHLRTDDKRAAMQRLPDVTEAQKAD
jgi:integrase